MNRQTDDAKVIPALLPIKGIYDPKSYHLLSKRKVSKTIIYLFLLAFIINLFTVILPYAPMIYQNHGIKYMLDVLIPDFEYNNGELTVPDFLYDVDEKNKTITLIDTNKEMAEEILSEYTSGIAVGKTSAFYKKDGITTQYTYKSIIPLESINKETLVSTKTILLIYLFLFLIVAFSNVFLFLMLLLEAFAMYVILTLMNIFIFKIKFNHKFRSVFNVGAYSLFGATLLKSFLHTFNIAPLPFQFCHWITILQLALCLTISILGLIIKFLHII
jgi:hypothetical protein